MLEFVVAFIGAVVGGSAASLLIRYFMTPSPHYESLVRTAYDDAKHITVTGRFTKAKYPPPHYPQSPPRYPRSSEENALPPFFHLLEQAVREHYIGVRDIKIVEEFHTGDDGRLRCVGEQVRLFRTGEVTITINLFSPSRRDKDAI